MFEVMSHALDGVKARKQVCTWVVTWDWSPFQAFLFIWIMFYQTFSIFSVCLFEVMRQRPLSMCLSVRQAKFHSFNLNTFLGFDWGVTDVKWKSIVSDILKKGEEGLKLYRLKIVV